MNIPEIAVQLHTFRHLTLDIEGFRKTCEKLGNMGIHKVELANLPGGVELVEISEILVQNGLECCGIHCPAEDLLNDPVSVMKKFSPIRTDFLCYPFPVGISFDSLPRIDWFLRKLRDVAKVMSQFETTFCYHHHDLEFRDTVGGRIFDRLIQNTDESELKMELDTYWLSFVGEDSAYWIQKLGGRCPLVHVKDIQEKFEGGFHNVEIGKGDIDWESVVKSAIQSNVQFLIIEFDEFDEGQDPFELVLNSRNYLWQLIENFD